MAKKSLTLKFGADTSKLSRAMKRLRTQITSSIGGGLRRGLGALTSLRGLALGGLAGFGAGKATNIFRNLSPKFNKAFEELSDVVQSRLTVVANKLAPVLEDFANWIARTISGADVAAAMDYIVPKIRALGDLMSAAVDVVKKMIFAVKRIPLVIENLGAGVAATYEAAIGAGINAGLIRQPGARRPRPSPGGAGDRARGAGGSLRVGS